MDAERLNRTFGAGWPDIDHFYDADERRLLSGEVDFGVQWRGAVSFPNFQLSWIVDTGELYLRKLPDGQLTVIAVIEDRDELERSLKGWAKACGPVGSLQWLLDWEGFGLGTDPGDFLSQGTSTRARGVPLSKFKGADRILYG
jgi:hypothetical protein